MSDLVHLLPVVFARAAPIEQLCLYRGIMLADIFELLPGNVSLEGASDLDCDGSLSLQKTARIGLRHIIGPYEPFV